MLIYGKNPVKEAICTGQNIDTLFLSDKKLRVYGEIAEIAKKSNIKVQLSDENFFFKHFKNSPHQGIAVSLKNISTVSHNLELTDKRFLVIADSIFDPMNLGAIIRSSVLFGVDGVIISEHESCGITPTVVKASSGAIFYQNIFIVKNLRNTMDICKSEGFWIYGLDGSSVIPLNKIKINKNDKDVLIVGSEGKGMHKLVEKNCDFIVKIPTTEKIDSLNAATAASVAMWEIYKRKSLS